MATDTGTKKKLSSSENPPGAMLVGGGTLYAFSGTKSKPALDDLLGDGELWVLFRAGKTPAYFCS